MPHLFFGVESGIIYEHPNGEMPVDTSGCVITDQTIPLAEFLVKDWFPFAEGDYPTPKRAVWSAEKIVEIGRKVVGDLAELDPPVRPNSIIVERLQLLGLFPAHAYFSSLKGQYKGLEDFWQTEIGEALSVAVEQHFARNRSQTFNATVAVSPRTLCTHETLHQVSLYFNDRSGELRSVSSEDGAEPPDKAAGWLPLAELVVAQEFPYTREDFPRPKTQPWDDTHIRRLGLLVAHDLAELDPPTTLTGHTVDRLSALGIFPSSAYFASSVGHYKGLTDFCQQIGVDKIDSARHIKNNVQRARINNEYAQLGPEDFAKLILERYNELWELPDEQLYAGPLTFSMIEVMNRMDIAPTWRFIKHTYGGLPELNEYLGFPNIRSWDETDYIQYGARFIKENGPNSLTETNLGKLSGRHLGPTKKPIAERFGSLSAFQNLAMAEYTRQTIVDEARSAAIERHFADIKYGYIIPEDPDERAKTWGRYLLAQSCLPKATKGELRELSRFHNGNFVERLLERRPDFSLADIEVTAMSLQVEDLIWPPVNQRSLKL